MKEKKYQFIVSEPWDYKNYDGKNFFEGHILKQIDADSIIFESDKVFKYNDEQKKLLLLTVRHYGNKLINMNKKTGVSVNAGVILTDDYMNKSAIELQKPENSKFVFIGGLYPVGTWK